MIVFSFRPSVPLSFLCPFHFFANTLFALGMFRHRLPFTTFSFVMHTRSWSHAVYVYYDM
jgi:hypothetical protein